MEELFHLKRRQNENLENVILIKSGESYFFDFPKVLDVYPKFQPNDPLQFVDPQNPEGNLSLPFRLNPCHNSFLSFSQSVNFAFFPRQDFEGQHYSSGALPDFPGSQFRICSKC